MAIKKISQKISQGPTQSRWSSAKMSTFMLNATYVCVALAILLSLAQFTLYGMRYKQVIDETTYQAVALDNGQTFFGKLRKYGIGTYVLVDAYYLQRNSDDATTVTGDAATETTTTKNNDNNKESDLELMPITGELHQPKNHIIINRDHIIFWQNLELDSPIVQTILKSRVEGE